jgi:hypothetical protein
MPRGPAPAWTARLEPLLDDHIIASMSTPMNPDTGFYGELIYAGCATEERAEEIKRALYRAANRQKVSLVYTIEKSGKEYQVRFTAINKSHARRHQVAVHGKDRSAWAYDPRKRGAA